MNITPEKYNFVLINSGSAAFDIFSHDKKPVVRNVRRNILVLFLIISSFSLKGQPRFGQIFGLNLSEMIYTSDGKSYTPSISPGIHFGGQIEMQIRRNLFFEPGLVFSSKGAVFKSDSGQFSISPIYLEIPAILSYSIGSELLKVTLEAGPYFACGIGGNTLVSGGQFKNISYGSEESDDLSRFDIGIKSGAGLSIKGFLIAVEYEFGLTNIAPYAKNLNDIENRVWAVSFITSFGSRK